MTQIKTRFLAVLCAFSFATALQVTPASALSTGVAAVTTAAEHSQVGCLSTTGGGGVYNECDVVVPVIMNLWVSTSGDKTYTIVARASTGGTVNCRAFAADKWGAWNDTGDSMTAAATTVYTQLFSTATVIPGGSFSALCYLGPQTYIQSVNW